MSLNFKHFELIEMLQQNCSFQEIIKKSNLSERNIRYQIDELNDELKSDYKIKVNKNDITLNNNFSSLHEIFKNFEKIFYSYSSQERIDLIIFKTLLKKESININRLSKELDITKPTLRNDLKKLKIYLEKFNINIIQKENSIYILKYNDLDLCYFLSSYLNKYENLTFNNFTLKKMSFFNLQIHKLFLEFFSDSYEILKNIRKNFSYTISDNSLNLFFCFLIGIIKFCPKIYFKTNQDFYLNSFEYIEIISKMKEFSQNQKLVITDFLIGLSYTKSNPLIIFNNWINIEIEIYKSIVSFSKSYSINLIHDKILMNELINHIKPMIYRSSKKIFLENSIYNEIVEIYENLFYTIKSSFNNLERNLNFIISNEEIAFITLMFHRALERNSLKKPIKKIAIICNYGLSASKFLEDRLNNTFYIETTKTFSLNEFYNLDFSYFDLIITTINLRNYSCNIPLIKVSPLLNEKDIKNLKQFNFKKQREKICFDSFFKDLKNNNLNFDKNKLKDFIFNNYSNFFVENDNAKSFDNNFIEKDLFSYGNCKDISEAITLSCKPLLEKNYINKSYLESLISPISLNNPNLFIGKTTIFPHAVNNNNVFSTKFSFLKLKEPIVINKNKCNFIITFCTDRKSDYVDFLIKITEFFNDSKNEKFLYSLNLDDIYKLINNL